MVDLFKKKQSNVKKILIYQHEDYHSEISGIILQNCSLFDVDVYYPKMKSTNNCFGYYSKIFNKKINYVTGNINIKSYHRIFFLTDKEIVKIKHDNEDKKKMIAFRHINTSEKKNHMDYFSISFLKMIHANLCMLPVYEICNNIKKRRNIISVVGNMSSPVVRDLDGILAVIEDEFIKKNYHLHIYTRKIEKNFEEKVSHMDNVKIHINYASETLIENVRTNKFLLTADTDYYRKVGPNQGVMTGIIPLGLNNEVPIILSNDLDKIYNLQGTIKYSNMKGIVDVLKHMDDLKYNKILRDFIDGKKKIIEKNKTEFSKLI